MAAAGVASATAAQVAEVASMIAPRVAVDRDRDHLDDAARIWAEATASRDGDPDPRSALELSREVIRRALDASPLARLLIAVDGAGEAVGFALTAPVPGARAGRTTAELKYIGVQPASWGRGVGSALLRAVPALLREDGWTHAVLEVYADNARAIRLYEEMGWRSTRWSRPHPTSERLLVELALTL